MKLTERRNIWKEIAMHWNKLARRGGQWWVILTGQNAQLRANKIRSTLHTCQCNTLAAFPPTPPTTKDRHLWKHCHSHESPADINWLILFEPLENAIRDQLIPALVGREVSDAERQILALPLRHGGLGLTNPRETAKTKYEHSIQSTNELTAKICTQKLDLDYNPLDQQFTRHTKKNTRRVKWKTSVTNFWWKWSLSHNNS